MNLDTWLGLTGKQAVNLSNVCHVELKGGPHGTDVVIHLVSGDSLSFSTATDPGKKLYQQLTALGLFSEA